MNDLKTFNFDCLTAHNGLRKAHGAEDLRYDEKLAEAAQEYAERLAKLEVLEHSKNSERLNIGENLSFSYKSYVNYKYSGRGATVSWYSEIKDYDFSKKKQKDGNPPTGHFTQIIWKQCKKAGFGRAQSKNKGWYIVGRYAPSGNVLGHYINNIDRSSYSKWEDVPIVLNYLEELRTMEFTSGRKHVLDECTSKTQVKNKEGMRTYTITETFDSPLYGTYSLSEDYAENPTKLERPEFKCSDEDYYVEEEFICPVAANQSEAMVESEEIKDFKMTILRRHNYYRAKHRVEPLQLDDSLSRLAQDWAEQLADENSLGQCNCRYNRSVVGENICTMSSDNIMESGTMTIDRWYNEESLYSYKEEPDNFIKVGHFTQIIWKNTAKIGVGIAQNESSQIQYVVCFYYPPGNVERDFTKNILKPTVR